MSYICIAIIIVSSIYLIKKLFIINKIASSLIITEIPKSRCDTIIHINSNLKEELDLLVLISGALEDTALKMHENILNIFSSDYNTDKDYDKKVNDFLLFGNSIISEYKKIYSKKANTQAKIVVIPYKKYLLYNETKERFSKLQNLVISDFTKIYSQYYDNGNQVPTEIYTILGRFYILYGSITVKYQIFLDNISKDKI